MPKMSQRQLQCVNRGGHDWDGVLYIHLSPSIEEHSTTTDNSRVEAIITPSPP